MSLFLAPNNTDDAEIFSDCDTKRRGDAAVRHEDLAPEVRSSGSIFTCAARVN